MKRNKTNRRLDSGGTSPYRKHGKRPFAYSTVYYAWRREITGKSSVAEREGRLSSARKNGGTAHAHA